MNMDLGRHNSSRKGTIQKQKYLDGILGGEAELYGWAELRGVVEMGKVAWRLGVSCESFVKQPRLPWIAFWQKHFEFDPLC